MAEDAVTRKLTTILSADVVGYSRLMHADEEGTLATLKTHRRELIDPKIAEHRGRIVKTTGDGMLLEFPSVGDAVHFAIEVQEAMTQRNADVAADRRMLFRVGINLGDVIVDEDDIFGDGVNVAARLETLARPGSICVSSIVRDQIAGKIDHAIHDMGDQALKNIEDPVHAYRILTGVTSFPTIDRAHVSLDSTSFEFSPFERPSIAILPFKNLSGDPHQDYLSEGLRLGILSSLVQLSGLFLIGTNAVNGYRGRDVPASQAGSEVRVRYVLDGAVQQAGNRIRATLQLTDVEAGEIIWAERYDRDLDDLFKMQDEITQEVIISLDVQLLGREQDRIWFSKLTSPNAREFFLRGISHFYLFNKEDNASARRLSEELYRVQPDSVYGPSIVGVTHWFDAFFGWSESPARSYEQAAEWAEKTIEYEDDNGLGHAILGHMQLLEGRHDEALAHCQIAAEIRSSCPLAFGLLASVQNYCGDSHAAIKNVKDALQMERIYPPWLVNVLATAYRDGGKVNLSIPAAREAARLDPQQTEARVILCSDYKLGGFGDEAKEVAREILSIDPAFRLSSFAESQPYKRKDTLDRLIETLRDAGLPD